MANAYLAVEQDLELIPVINKIDLTADPDRVAMEIENVFGLLRRMHLSRPKGCRYSRTLDAICDRLPDPRVEKVKNTRGLIFDAVYDDYRGVVVYTRLFDGSLKVGDKIRMMGTGRTTVTELGRNTPFPVKVKEMHHSTWIRRGPNQNVG